MKIIVYAICKNEEKFAKTFALNMSEADQIIILDTGSTDNTVNILKQYKKVKVYQKTFSPWRFDDARNYCLSLVPSDADVCICVDLDERFTPNWRTEVEKCWQKNTTRASYKYVWNHDEKGNDGICFNLDKMHSRFGYFWVNPVHEVLQAEKSLKENKVHIENIVLHHYADIAKSRACYLPLLELAVKENPQNDRNMHYLGREYMFYGEHEKSIQTLKKHLKLKSATWADERCASLRFIAKQYAILKKYKLAEKYFKLAIIEAPFLREPKLEFAEFLFTRKKYADCIIYLNALEQITERSYNYISDPKCWSEYPYDLASICYYELKIYSKAYSYAQIAHQLALKDERIAQNLEFFKSLLNKQ